MTPGPVQPVLPATWQQVLASIESSLAEALHPAAARGGPPPATGPSAGAPGPIDQAWAEAMTRFESSLAGIQQGLERAAEETRLAEAELSARIDDLRRWLDQSHAARGRLASALDRAV